MDDKQNIREGNTVSDAFILQTIANSLNKSITMIARETKEKTGTLYSITAGVNKFSPRMITNLTNQYPEINIIFIDKGTGEPIRTGASLITQNNFLGRPNEIDFQKEIFANLTLINKKLTFLQQDLDEIKRKINN